MFSLRIVTTDYRMDKPIAGIDVRVSDFRSSPIHRVPVIRIFGSTPLGQKACLCLHGIFPYLYVTMDSNFPPNDCQLQQFAASVDQALNVALGRTTSYSQHVYKITVVSGIPFYGYHAKECLFLKIFLYNPIMVKKVADLLLAGAIMNRSFQPLEAHIPYVLQMFMDYNLFGMNFIHLSDVKFRLPVPSSDLQWNSVSVVGELVCYETRSTSCELEVDAHACSILNREELSGRMVGNPGLMALWQEERVRCKRNNLEAQLTPPFTPERFPLLISAEQKLKTQLVEMLKSLNNNNVQSELSEDSRKPLNETFSEDDSEAIICEKTIMDVVSHSENFLKESAAKSSEHLCDSSFANMLASLAMEQGFSQKPKNVVELEEWDSVLSQNVQLKAEDRKMVGGNGDGDGDDIISLEMSQCFDPESLRGFEARSGQTSKKHQLTSDDQNEDRKIKKLKTASSPLPTRKLMRMKSQLLKRQRCKFQMTSEKLKVFDEELEFTSIKTNNTKYRLRSSKVLVVDRIPADADEVVEPVKVNKDSKPTKTAKLFSDLIRKLKDKVDEVTNSSNSPQHDALEGLAFLSSPDSSSSLCVSLSDPNQILLNDSIRILDSPSEVEDETTLVEQQESKKDASKVFSVSLSHSLHAAHKDIEEGSTCKARARRTEHIRNVRKIEAKYPPLAYCEVEKDILCGRFKPATVIRLRNAEKILEKREVLSRTSEQLVLHPGFVKDLTEHDNYGLAFGLNDLKLTLKGREELSGTSLKKPNKVKTKHLLAPFLIVDRTIHITPQTSPPTFNSVVKSLNSKMAKNKLTSQVDPQDPLQNNINAKHPLKNSFSLPQHDVADFSSSQLNIRDSHDSIAAHSKKICSSTPLPHSIRPSLPVDLDVTPIAKTTTNISLAMDLSDGKINKSATLIADDEKKEPKKALPMNIVNRIKKFESQIEAATPANVFNFKVGSQNLRQSKSSSENQYLCIVSLELHIATRGRLNPDPEFDGIVAAFYHISDERPSFSRTPGNDSSGQKASVRSEADEEETKLEIMAESRSVTGVFLVLDSSCKSSVTLRENVRLNFCRSETEVVEMMVDLVKRCDADILVGYEIQKLSWGYLIRRAAVLDVYLPAKLSRFEEKDDSSKKKSKFQKDQTSEQHAEDVLHSSEVFIPGRIVLNLWRILRHQVSLNIYTFENVAFHVLHQRVPHFSFQVLTFWFNHKNPIHRWKTIEYYVMRCRGSLQIMEQLDLVGQTSEFARIYGIEFFDVLNRGSQYRVESMMLRLAKPQNFIAVSPSVQQRAAMRSPECIPLNLEPLSDFYTDPVVVLDFQSLYPSVMIAYNYCFSTCLGRMQHFSKAKEGPFEFGCTSLNVPPDLLESLKDDVNICSNGVVFIKSNIRKGILPSMVEEILNTRLMVKKAMKVHKGDKGLQRILHSRQLGLKLIANVTFGYTAANFSGRMACVEVGDSIMRKARDTLEAAISLVEKNLEWGAEVVYGDTDSMFVLLRGRSKDQAFRIGQEIADAVTMSNPKPVKLKLEKVYMPCILQTKKRYVGFMYETPDQKEPVFDAKGIETVRRDNCPVVSKILEKSLKTLFTTCDLNLVKVYIQKQCIKVLDGRTPLHDFIFAKEYRGMAQYQPNACIPALEIARQRLLRDRRSEPLIGERVPYVVVHGMPDQPLIKLVREPHELLEDGSLRINSTYYLLKQVLPTINRFTMLFGVEALQWFHDMPRTLKLNAKLFDCPITEQNEPHKNNLNQYFTGGDCLVCGELCSCDVCSDCRGDNQKRMLFLSSQARKSQAQLHEAQKVCTACKGWQEQDESCTSSDCPIFFRRVRSTGALLRTEALLSKLQNL